MDRETWYSVLRKECLAIHWPVKALQYYLFRTLFPLIPDHSALWRLQTMKDSRARLPISTSPYRSFIFIQSIVLARTIRMWPVQDGWRERATQRVSSQAQLQGRRGMWESKGVCLKGPGRGYLRSKAVQRHPQAQGAPGGSQLIYRLLPKSVPTGTIRLTIANTALFHWKLIYSYNHSCSFTGKYGAKR